MKTKMKVLITILIVVSLLSSMIIVFRANSESDYTYILINGGASIQGYNGTDTNVVVPDTLGGQPVIRISDQAFSNHRNMTSISLPDTVQKIGRYAFDGCSGLTEITLPRDLTYIDSWAFNGSGLRDIIFNDKLESFGEYAFFAFPIKALNFPTSLQSIPDNAFTLSKLSYIRVPHNVTSIGNNAFKSTQKDLVIVGCAGSYAQTYANSKNIPFAVLPCLDHTFVRGECCCCAILLGDCNSDGIRDMADLNLLTSYVDGTADCPDIGIADMNQDGVLDILDENLLMRLLLGQDIWS